MPKNIQAYLLGLFSCMVWSTNFLIARKLNHDIPPITLNFWRWFFACVFIFWIARKNIKTDLPSFKKSFLLYLPLAIVGVSLFNSIIYIASYYTYSSNIALILSTSPIFVVILSLLLKTEILSSKKIIGILLSILGALVALCKGDPTSLFEINYNKGDILVLFASILWAIYCVLLKYVPKETKPSSFLFFTSALGVLILFPFYILEARSAEYFPFSGRNLMIFTYLGAAVSVAGFLGWYKAVSIIGPIRTAIIYYTIPLFTSIGSAIFLNESLQRYNFIAFALIFAGILISYSKHKLRSFPKKRS